MAGPTQRTTYLKYNTHGEIKLICGNLFEQNFTAEYDVIFANQILEHLVHAIDFIRKLNHGLKPGGQLIMSMPNDRYVKNTPLETPWTCGHMKFRPLHHPLPARLLNALDQLNLRWPALAWRSGFQLLAHGQKA